MSQFLISFIGGSLGGLLGSYVGVHMFAGNSLTQLLKTKIEVQQLLGMCLSTMAAKHNSEGTT